jgi:4-amino-4-deoxy-L-arabinose transferase-like glycosyltransferase
MRIPKRDIVFLLTAYFFVLVAFFLYWREFCYDPDIAGYVYNTLDVIRGKGWYYSSWHTKPPGINFIILAAFKFFGESFKSIYLAALFFNLTSVSLTYLLARVILSKETRFYFLVPLFFSLLFVSEPFKACAANSEIFLIPFEIVAILLLSKNKNFLCGLAIGTGFLIRQSALFTLLAALAFISFTCLSQRRQLIKNLFFLILAFILPTVLVSVYFLSQGVLDRFLNHSFVYNLKHLWEYVGEIRQKDLYFVKKSFGERFIFEIVLFGVLALLGALSGLIIRSKGKIIVFFWFVVVAVCLFKIGIFPHHFIQLIAPLAAVIVLGITWIFEGIRRFFQKRGVLRNTLFVSLAVVLFIPYARMASFYLDKSKPQQLHKSGDRFLAAQYVKEHTMPQDKIFVWDNIKSGAIVLWSARENVGPYRDKYAFLPNELREYWTPFYNDDYRISQEKLLAELYFQKPQYIILVFDYFKIIRWRGLTNGDTASREEKESAARRAFMDEKDAFPAFFALLDKEYWLEKAFGKCLVWKRWKK